MLGEKTYTKAYIVSCRERIDAQLEAYRDLAASAKGATRTALEAFEPLFFNNLVLVLDESFVHRLRGVEGKDGNAMNEVRVLVTSLLANDGCLVADKQIKLEPETSVLGLAVGDPIAIGEADFVRLADAYFAAIEASFGE